MSKNNTLKTPLYGNCQVQKPDGTHIFSCGNKKANWYLKRKLATTIQQEPLVIKLNFEPNGLGNAKEPFFLQKRENRCVCCGSLEALTRHHIVPFCFRKFFPVDIKDHNAYDVLPLCHNCHDEYEQHANILKKEIISEYGVVDECSQVIDKILKKVCLSASVLLERVIPLKRYNLLLNVLRVYYKKDNITTEDIENAAGIKYIFQKDGYKSPYQSVVEQITDIEVFTKRWRKHFVEHTKSKYLPTYWSVDRLLTR